MAPPNVKIKHLIRSTSGNSRFPKLDECAHFHYENVELGPIKVVLCDKQQELSKIPAFLSSSANKENEVDCFCFLVLVVSNNRKWVVRRSHNDFVFLDTQLHRCVYDRKYSLLKELQNVTQEDLQDQNAEATIRASLTEYLERFSQLAGSLITCGPVLNWLELDNRGNRLIVTDEVAINTPAVAAAYVVVRYTAQAADEISFCVGDMISVIDMPPPDESTWWRGKRGFEVGFFPSECVEVIGDKVPRGFKLSNTSTKPVFRKHGKLIAFFRSFLLSRPSRRKLKQSGILKERVFGCDLGEHLLNTAREIPLVLKCCTEFIEEFGVVDGIYRLSGVSSNIQRLRNAFDEDCATNLGDPAIAQDIHSVASLLKMYFRELPNPLLTYQLYDKFVSAVQSSEEVRLLRIRDVVQQLPPPHYRTLQYLLCHLARVASHGEQTGMTPKNIAIVWAPNLLRSRDVENGGVGALHVVGVQAVLTEYLIRYCDLIFDEKSSFLSSDDNSLNLRARPKSLAISTPTKLLSLEEARARALSAHLPLTQQKYIDVGGGPEKLPSKYHTVIELPPGKQGCSKLKKSPSGWKSFFSRGWYSGSTRDKNRPSFRSSRKSSTVSLPHASTQLQEKVSISSSESQCQRKKLRTVKSAESLIQCSKDSSPTSNIAPRPGSRKSSPEASMDSFSLDAGSKSPSLQKHTRSSSHESYFDNSMDMMSDPPAEEEEEHSLFYYVNEQMQKMQESSPTLWQRKRLSHYDGHNAQIPIQDVDLECSLPPAQQDDSSSDIEKNVRKQKLNVVDDFANAKVQRLSLIEPENPEIPRMDDSLQFKSPVEDCSFWLPRSDQALFCKLSGNHDEGYKLDPFAFYDCALDKRLSCISSSDNEAESATKTVVERYGNAETILVEVHATQDSSSESESELSKFLQHFDCVLPPPKPPAEWNNSILREDFIDESSDVSKHGSSVDEGEHHAITDSVLSEEIVIDKTTEEDSEEEEECPTLVDVGSERLLLVHLENSSDNNLPHPQETSDEVCSSTLICVAMNEDFKKPTEEAKISSDSSEEFTAESPVKEELCSSEKISDDSEKMDTDCDVYRVKTPPSPVYPQSMKTEFHSLELKLESVPLHKKRQIFSIPSPSSPIDEVRKKFELQVSNAEKKEISSYKSPQSFKDTPSKLSMKQKQVFEVQDTPNVSFSKRKSDGVILSSKVEGIPSKRNSEPLVPMEVTSPTEKASRCSKSEPSNNASSPTDTKAKTLSPSLFTQLKVRKLQSLQGSTPTTPVKVIDPWNDPILDMQEEYHPLPSYSKCLKDEGFGESESTPSTLVRTSPDVAEIRDSAASLPDIHQTPECENLFEEQSIVDDSTSKLKESPLPKDTDSESIKLPTVTVDESSDSERLPPGLKISADSVEDEFVRRERINRIKEERRAQLREKLKTESFRMEAEEKERVQSKFRLRKDIGRQVADAPIEEKKDERDELPCAKSKDSDTKQDSPICDISVSTQSQNQKDCLPSSVDVRKSSNPDVEPRSSVFRRSNVPGDIRDRVAMFERSKDTKEPCRLGPNGKFPSKQGTTTSLTPSYVR